MAGQSAANCSEVLMLDTGFVAVLKTQPMKPLSESGFRNEGDWAGKESSDEKSSDTSASRRWPAPFPDSVNGPSPVLRIILSPRLLQPVRIRTNPCFFP